MPRAKCYAAPWRVYNNRVPAAKPENESSSAPGSKPPRRSVYASETVGLVLIAVVLLILTLVRYWHDIHWSWR